MALEALVAEPRRVLAIYAHPDDPDVSCGGTLARWSATGVEVHVVLAALGDKGTSDAAADALALVERRAGEVERARRVLGVSSVTQLGRPDGEVDNDLELRRRLVGCIRKVRPDAVVCPDPLAVFFGEHYYNHRDHREIGFAALDAVSPAAASPLYFPSEGAAWQVEVAYLSGSLEPAVFVDVSATIGVKVEAVLCHVSQLGEAGEHLAPLVEERAADAGRRAGVAYAETFRRVRFAEAGAGGD